MNCPNCDGDSFVVDSRVKKDYGYRRRECKVCNVRFSTREICIKGSFEPTRKWNETLADKNQARLKELANLINEQEAEANSEKFGYFRGVSRHSLDEWGYDKLGRG